MSHESGGGAGPRPRPGVIVPTTSEPITIESLKRRKRLPASYVALKGDFRPLQISSDYDRFVRGPLQAILGELVSFELVLDGDIDCGRSWELPVLIAHWLEVAQGAQAGAGRADAAPMPLVWATGMVDADLRPLPSDYHIPRKIAACADNLPGWRADFGSVIAIVPKTAEPDEEARIREVFAAEDIPVHFIADFEELDAVLRSETGRAVQTPADPPVAAADAAGGPASGRRGGRGVAAWRWGVAGLAAAGLFVFFVPILSNGSVISTLLGNPGDKEQALRVPGEPALSVNGLFAEDRTECIEKIFSGAPLDIQAATKTVDGFSLQTGAALCGLAFRNHSLGTIEVTLDADLIGRGIAGSSSLATPMVLAPNQSRELIFAEPPGVLSAATRVSEPGEPDRHWTIRLQ